VRTNKGGRQGDYIGDELNEGADHQTVGRLERQTERACPARKENRKGKISTSGHFVHKWRVWGATPTSVSWICIYT